MANSEPENAGSLEALLNEKQKVLGEVLILTQQELLLVDLDKLSPLLERKDQLLERVADLDRKLSATGRAEGAEWESMPQHREMAEIIQAILENEAVLEKRIQAEFSELRGELRELNQETRLKKYLEGQSPRKGRVDLKR